MQEAVDAASDHVGDQEAKADIRHPLEGFAALRIAKLHGIGARYFVGLNDPNETILAARKTSWVVRKTRPTHTDAPRTGQCQVAKVPQPGARHRAGASLMTTGAVVAATGLRGGGLFGLNG